MHERYKNTETAIAASQPPAKVLACDDEPVGQVQTWSALPLSEVFRDQPEVCQMRAGEADLLFQPVAKMKEWPVRTTPGYHAHRRRKRLLIL